MPPMKFWKIFLVPPQILETKNVCINNFKIQSKNQMSFNHESDLWFYFSPSDINIDYALFSKNLWENAREK